MSSEPALIIFIRNPELGKVKTRIAKTVGDKKAFQVYLSLLDHIRSVAEKLDGVTRYLYYSDFIDPNDQWSHKYFNLSIQSKGNIGMKMDLAFQSVLKQHPSAVIIGSDIASLTTEILEKAFEVLLDKDFVLGPAMDGGYYLLGMKQPSPSLFSNMEWSTDEVFNITRKRIETKGGSLGLVDELSDIDHWEDWVKYGWEL